MFAYIDVVKYPIAVSTTIIVNDKIVCQLSACLFNSQYMINRRMTFPSEYGILFLTKTADFYAHPRQIVWPWIAIFNFHVLKYFSHERR